MKISREVKTAILIIAGIILFIFGFNYLKGKNLLNASRTFYTSYNNVEGLAISTPVTINGLIVGKVQNIAFEKDGSARLKVTLLVENSFAFSKNSKAELYEAGLIGGKAVAIVPTFDGAENAKDGATLEGTVKAGLTELVNQRLTPLQEKIETVMVSTDSLLKNLNDIFDEQTKDNLKSSIAGLNETILSFKETSNSLTQLINNNKGKLDSTLTNVENITSNLSKVSDSLASANLGETIKNLESTINNFEKLLAAMEAGEGSMGKLMKDEALYNNLEGTTKEMKELLRDIKLHPKRYFRILSKKEIPYEQE